MLIIFPKPEEITGFCPLTVNLSNYDEIAITMKLQSAKITKPTRLILYFLNMLMLMDLINQRFSTFWELSNLSQTAINCSKILSML